MPVFTAAAEPIELLSLPGDQTSPTLAEQKLIFVEEAGGARNVFLADLANPSSPIVQLSLTGDVLGGPETAGAFVAFRRSGWIERYSLATGRTMVPLAAPGDGRVAVSQQLVAWEQQEAGGSDVAWAPAMVSADPVVYARPGAQRAVAATFGWIAYVDDAEGGSVHLLDTTRVDPYDAASFAAADTVLYSRQPGDPEPAIDVALWSADEFTAPRIAVTVAQGPLDDDILLFESAASAPVRLGTGGAKRNVHLVRDWVAYDGYSTGISQVWLWDWTRQLNFYAAWTDTPQSLNHLVAADSGVQVVWTGVGTQGLDIFQFILSSDDPPDDPGPGSVTCASADAVVLADFTVTVATTPVAVVSNRDDGDRDDDDDRDDKDARDEDHGADGWHLRDSDAHDERWHSDWKWRAFGHAEFASPRTRRVRVCMDAAGISSAWVGVGSQVVAMPADFSAGTLSREASVTIGADDGRAAALVIARRGGSLRVRVLDDPYTDPGAPAGGDTCSSRGDCPSPRGWTSRFGCGSSGGSASLASLLLLGLVAARPLRRSRR
jgi:hypothetical protein